MLKHIVNATSDPTMTSPLLKLRLDEVVAVESGYAEVLAGVLGVDAVPGGSHFFDDLDADSMVMARFCARVRKRDDLPTVSMKDIYKYPTVTSLAVALGQTTPSNALPIAQAAHQRGRTPVRDAVDPSMPGEPIIKAPNGSTPRYLLCGGAQALIAMGGAYLAATVLDWGFTWLTQVGDLRALYIRALVLGLVTLLGMCVVPIVAKWVLIGRWTTATIEVWSLAYLRFWCVKTLIRSSPLVLFAGSPIYTVYLRLLGAKIGKGVTVFSPTPVCTDLLSIGANTVIRKDAQLAGYRAVAGVIEIGPITLGDSVIVGEQIVIDINTEIGQGARLGHSSSLHAGQRVPAGQYWHGSPARPAETPDPTVSGADAAFPHIDPARCGTPRRVLYSLWQLVIPVAVYVPLVLAAPVLLAKIPTFAPLVGSGPSVLTHLVYYRDIALIALMGSIGFVLANLLFIMTVPRLLNMLLTPGRVYPLFGFHYWLTRTITRRTNSAFFMQLVGDSSYVVHYLRALGYDLGDYEQTGSNFGVVVKHDNPYLCSVGAATMVADGLSMINIDYSSTSFRLTPVSVGARSFLGNAIAYPAHARVGDNCLLATKVMVPAQGPVREGVGLLGAPSFSIPRTVERDTQLEVTDPEQLRRLLRAKNRHNTATIAGFLVARWIPMFMTVLLAETSDLVVSLGAWALMLAAATSTAIGLAYLVGLQRCVNWLQALRPNGCSIYDRAFWRHERYWKIPGQTWMQAFNGTPFKPLIWRALGVRIGRRVFDDGLGLVEKSLVTIGDDATLNAGSVIQCHSQEDGAFKSDRTTIGHRVTLGVGAFVHYGVTIDDAVVLAPDTFVMKGEELPADTRWIGNPAALAVTTAPAGLPHAPAALPLDSAPVTAALAVRPRAVVEWNGQGWSFPDVEHYTEPAEGAVTRLRVDRPGTLRLTGSGENLRIELIPDDHNNPNPTPIGLPLPSQLLALTDPHHIPHPTAHRGLSRPIAAGLLLLVMLGAGATLLDVTHVLPTSALIPDTTCLFGGTGCASNSAARTTSSKTQPAAPHAAAAQKTAPDDTTSEDSGSVNTEPDSAVPGGAGPDHPPPDNAKPRQLEPTRPNGTPSVRKPAPQPAPLPPLPVVHKPAPAARRPLPTTAPGTTSTGRAATGTTPDTSGPAPAQSPAPRTNPDGSTTNPDGSITNPDGTITNPDGTITNPDGTITKPHGTITKKKKSKKSKSSSSPSQG